MAKASLYSLIVLASIFLEKGYTLECLSCHAVIRPRNCDVVTTCGFNEVCYANAVETLDGIKAYRLGCTPQNNTACHEKGADFQCSECCSQDLCNAELCGEPGYPLQRGPICYSCTSRPLDRPCHVINFCRTDEVCSLSNRRIFLDSVYSSGCSPKHECDLHNHGNIIIGKRNTFGNAFEDDLTPGFFQHCCSKDLCNINTGARDCLDILRLGYGTESGVYIITLPKSGRSIEVYCDLKADGGGWTVFQNRFNGSVDFYRNFTQYENGFGNIRGEFWLGLKYIYELSACAEVDLRLDLQNSTGVTFYEEFGNFSLSPATDYNLHINRGTGTAGDTSGMSYSNGFPFSTYDHRNYGGCAIKDHGGWWYGGCVHANLNGIYTHPPGSSANAEAGFIYRDVDDERTLKASKLMIRRKGTPHC